MGHSAYVYHMDDDYFEDARTFRPERWLGDNFNELDSRMVSFSKGTRSCLGMKSGPNEKCEVDLCVLIGS